LPPFPVILKSISHVVDEPCVDIGTVMFVEGRTTASLVLVLVVGLDLFCTELQGQQRTGASPNDTLEQLSSSLQEVVAKVSSAIVRVEALGYTRTGNDEESPAHSLMKSEVVASGIILDPNGYIVTNAHVLQGARRVRVILSLGMRPSGGAAWANSPALRFDARIIGSFADADLAVLKIEATGLPVLPPADSDSIRPGQLVLAVGNPEGLNNSVSMGVVSAVARQEQPEGSMVYIQTDAAINHGSSGGALVDIHGGLVGVTSFMVTEGGGSEGLGFALPTRLVYLIYQQLRAKGHVEVGDIGVRVQEITSTMALGLRLSERSGLIIADIIPDGPAEVAGLQVQDTILSLDGSPVTSLPQFAMCFYAKHSGDRVKLELLRGSRRFTADVSVRERAEELDEVLEKPDLQENVVSTLGIVAATLNDHARTVSAALRSRSGVMVLSELAHNDIRTGLRVDDLIRAVNGSNVQTVENLRSLLQQLKSGDPVVLQIERRGKLKYLSFELD
jgi:serine protease Do